MDAAIPAVVTRLPSAPEKLLNLMSLQFADAKLVLSVHAGV